MALRHVAITRTERVVIDTDDEDYDGDGPEDYPAISEAALVWSRNDDGDLDAVVITDEAGAFLWEDRA